MQLKIWSRLMAIFLCAALAIKTSQCFADDDSADYRHEFYREDDHRMSVDTDSASFDIGLGSHVRLNGEWVLDSISGATPTGAPPQTQWPFATKSYYYNQAFAGYLQQAINDPNNQFLYQFGYFNSYPNPFQAYTNYVATNGNIVANQAAAYAGSAYARQTNNPSYHNNTVPTTQLNDLRRSGNFSLPITFDIHQFTPQVSISEEHDYHSYGVALGYAIQLNEKNTTLNVGWSHDSDRVRNGSPPNYIWSGKVSDDFIIGMNQLLTPKSYFTLDFTCGQEYGYLDDPYRGVMVIDALNPQTVPDSAALTPENRPRTRKKEIFYASYTQFIETLNGSADLSYRFFHDDSGIFAHTVDAEWHQKILKNLILTPSFRYYHQTAASYYATIFSDAPSLPQYYSADYRLSRLESFTLGAALHYRVIKYFAIDFAYSRYIMRGLDGVTSQSAYPSANTYSIGGRIFF